MIKVLDSDLIKETVATVNALPERSDRVEEIKAALAAGTYKHTGEEIADAMARRALADRIN
jgi:anti-sigma28 factor (negative regulator of flagellin synthesis)